MKFELAEVDLNIFSAGKQIGPLTSNIINVLHLVSKCNSSQNYPLIIMINTARNLKHLSLVSSCHICKKIVQNSI